MSVAVPCILSNHSTPKKNTTNNAINKKTFQVSLLLNYIQTPLVAVSSPPASPVFMTPLGSTSITLHSFSA